MEKQDQERAVKGSMVLPAVKVIKTMKDKPWDQYLSDEAKDLVSQRILPSVWYPSEPMIDLMEAIYKVVAQGKPELAIQWGKLNFQQLTNSIYKNIIVPGDAYETLKKIEVIAFRAFIKGLKFEVKEITKKHVQVLIFDDDPRTEPMFYVALGGLQGLFEMMEDEKAKVEITQKHWEGHEATVFDIHLSAHDPGN